MYIQQHVTAVTSHSPGFDQQHSIFLFPRAMKYTTSWCRQYTQSLAATSCFSHSDLYDWKLWYTQSSLSKPVRSIELHHFFMLTRINSSLEWLDSISKRPFSCSSCLTTIMFPNISCSSLSRPTLVSHCQSLDRFFSLPLCPLPMWMVGQLREDSFWMQ